MKSLIIFPVSFLIALYVIIGMIIPKYQDFLTMRDENKIVEVKIEDQQEKLTRIQTFIAELNSFPGEVAFLNEYVPSNPLEQELISTLAQFGLTTNVSVSSVDMSNRTSSSGSNLDSLGRLGTTVEITGSYDEILPFIDNIFRIKRLYNLNTVSISEVDESATFNDPDVAQSDDLALNLDFDYIFIENLQEVSADDFAEKVPFEDIAAVRDQTNPVNPIISSPSERSNPFLP